MFRAFYRRFLAPLADSEDDRRRELVLNLLLCGSIILCAMAAGDSIAGIIRHHSFYTDSSLPPLATIGSFFLFLYGLSRFGFHRPAAYLFVLSFLIVTTYPLAVWGIQLPQAILSYSLIVVMAGVLLGSRIAFIVTAVMVTVLLLLIRLQEAGVLDVDMSWETHGGTYGDAFTYGCTLLLIALVSWLSNRGAEQSLARARRSEQALRKERNSLERKVRERTKQLERTQIEKMLELQRFAEFGRLSSTLLHDLANPLTSVSIELEQLADTEYAQLIDEARKGITSMERYVRAARRQLRNESEIRLFNAAEELRLVTSFLESKARGEGVQLRLQLDDGLSLYGDSIKFNQIMANLIANAIDAYDGMYYKRDKAVDIRGQVIDDIVEFTIRDIASGMPPEVLLQIFEPFFTTKSGERGSGLGLYISRLNVEEGFRGKILVESKVGKGTCFTVQIPKA